VFQLFAFLPILECLRIMFIDRELNFIMAERFFVIRKELVHCAGLSSLPTSRSKLDSESSMDEKKFT